MIHIVKKGCPICNSDVKGDDEHKYYCAHCNILFSRVVKAGASESPDDVKVFEDMTIVRDPGWLYFVDKQGDVSRVRMARSRADKGPKKHEKVMKFGIKKEKGYLYFIDKNGCVARTLMKRIRPSVLKKNL